MAQESECSERKWSHQLGLYRTRMDAKTEEFLRMSRRRQMRSGATCAALASAITTVFVVIIILVYEYTLADTSYAGQSFFTDHYSGRNKTQSDHPVAHPLNRRRFIADQESFSKMPLLINALQENSYLDPTADHQLSSNSGSGEIQGRSLSSWTDVHKTSPRPFNYDLRTPSPSPFKKVMPYSSRTWLDNYRSAQRLKNLEHVINYLQKTVHAKVADLAPSSSDRLVTFSGAFIHPTLDEKHLPGSSSLTSSESRNVLFGQPFKSDILYKYKPNHPGEVNMLADEVLRFSPIVTSKLSDLGKKQVVPLFRPMKFPPRETCYGIKCPPHDFVIKHPNSSGTEYKTNHSRLLSLMLDLFPMDNKDKEPFQLRRKISNLQLINPSFRPKPMSKLLPFYQKKNEINLFNNRQRPPSNPNVLNTLFSPPRLYGTVRNLKILDPGIRQSNTISETSTETQSKIPSTTLHYETSSSRSVPVTTGGHQSFTTLFNPTHSLMTETPNPIDQNFNLNEAIARLNNLLNNAKAIEETITVPPPDIVKFNPEDAKVPDLYQYNSQRRSSLGFAPNASFSSSTPNNIDTNTDGRSMIIKLLKPSVEFKSSTVCTSSTQMISTNMVPVSTTTQPSNAEVFATQNNGHHRSLHQNLKTVNERLSTTQEPNLTTNAPLVTTTEIFRPSYVVINRNNTRSNDQQFGVRIKKTRDS